MFTINPAPTFVENVKLGNPPASLSIMFRYMKRTEFRAWRKRAVDIALIPEGDERDRADAEWLMECMAGWGQPHPPVTADGGRIEFNLTAVLGLYDTYHAFGRKVFDTYEAALYEFRQGN